MRDASTAAPDAACRDGAYGFRSATLARVPAPDPGRRIRPGLDAAALVQVRTLLADGASWHTIAAALNASGSRNPHGVRWRAQPLARAVRAAVVQRVPAAG